MFTKIWLNPMESHNPDYDILCGRVDEDTFITYCLQLKGPCPGAETIEIYTGPNYSPKSKKRSRSRHYSQEAIPKVWRAQWLKLKELYEAQHKRN